MGGGINCLQPFLSRKGIFNAFKPNAEPKGKDTLLGRSRAPQPSPLGPFSLFPISLSLQTCFELCSGDKETNLVLDLQGACCPEELNEQDLPSPSYGFASQFHEEEIHAHVLGCGIMSPG